MRGFASDNNSGIHPRILEAISSANIDHAVAYGDDPWTNRAKFAIQNFFAKEVETFFVFNGTAANTLSISALLKPFHAVICTDTAHIQVDECGAPERFSGAKLIPISTKNGKLNPQLIEPRLHGVGNQHHVQPKLISISQTTELGTVYSPEEIRNLALYAHRHGLFLHVDGARISNAAASLGISLSEMLEVTGVDVFTFGGTKNGLLLGEAVVFLNRSLAEDFQYIRKQGMQLASKMRFLSCQFEAFLQDDLWLKNAKHANFMAQRLAEAVRNLPKVRITQDVAANAVFVALPREVIAMLQKKFFFYVWDENESIVRWMTSFDTSEQDIDAFVTELKKVLS